MEKPSINIPQEIKHSGWKALLDRDVQEHLTQQAFFLIKTLTLISLLVGALGVFAYILKYQIPIGNNLITILKYILSIGVMNLIFSLIINCLFLAPLWYKALLENDLKVVEYSKIVLFKIVLLLIIVIAMYMFGAAEWHTYASIIITGIGTLGYLLYESYKKSMFVTFLLVCGLTVFWGCCFVLVAQLLQAFTDWDSVISLLVAFLACFVMCLCFSHKEFPSPATFLIGGTIALGLLGNVFFTGKTLSVLGIGGMREATLYVYTDKLPNNHPEKNTTLPKHVCLVFYFDEIIYIEPKKNSSTCQEVRDTKVDSSNRNDYLILKPEDARVFFGFKNLSQVQKKS